MILCSYRQETDSHQVLLTVSTPSQLKYICSIADIEPS